MSMRTMAKFQSPNRLDLLRQRISRSFSPECHMRDGVENENENQKNTVNSILILIDSFRIGKFTVKLSFVVRTCAVELAFI